MVDAAGVEIPQYLRGYLEFPQASEVKQSLPCLPHRRVSVQLPGQALCDVDTKVLEAVQNKCLLSVNMSLLSVCVIQVGSFYVRQ